MGNHLHGFQGIGNLHTGCLVEHANIVEFHTRRRTLSTEVMGDSQYEPCESKAGINGVKNDSGKSRRNIGIEHGRTGKRSRQITGMEQLTLAETPFEFQTDIQCAFSCRERIGPDIAEPPRCPHLSYPRPCVRLRRQQFRPQCLFIYLQITTREIYKFFTGIVVDKTILSQNTVRHAAGQQSKGSM